MSTHDDGTKSVPAAEGWGRKRLGYNIGLVVAGTSAFLCYALVLFANTDVIPDAEITLFTMAFQGVGYLFAMAIANVCYFLGPISERLLNPRDLDSYRRTTFALGFWFSVALPFSIPLLLLYLCTFYPSYWN